MKPTKLILIFFLACSLQPAACSLIFAAGANITVVGDTQGDSLSLTPQTTRPAVGSEGEIIYSDEGNENELYVWGGSQWGPVGGSNKNVATKIVAASDSKGAADYVCDGTDDQQEINQAINAIVNSGKATEGVVYLLDGTYNISAVLLDGMTTAGIVMQSGISLIGTGAGTVLRVAASANFNVINAASVNRILISQLKIDGNKSVFTGSNQGIYFGTVTDSKIAYAWIENMRASGIYLTASSNNTLSGNNVQGSTNIGDGIYLTASSNNNILSGNNLQGNLGGIYVDSSRNNTISGNNVQGGGNYGIRLYSSSNNTLSGNNVAGIYLGYGSSNNTLSGNNVQGYGGHGIRIWDDSNNNAVSGNNVQGNGGYGISIWSASDDNILSGNSISNNGANVQDGINIGDDSDRNLISANLLSDTAGTGRPIKISVLGGVCDNNYIVGNLIASWPAGYNTISDSGTGTKYTGKDKITLQRANQVLSLSATGQIDPGTNPSSYIPIQGSGGSVTLSTDPPILAGKAAGDILILEGTSSNTVTIPANTTTTRFPASPPRTLGKDDTLTLIWNGGVTPYWLELSYTNN